MLNMDLDEWELLPTDALINPHQFPSSPPSSSSSIPNSSSLIDMDYFQKLIDPPHTKKILDSRVVVPIEFDHGEIPVEEKEIPEDQNFEEKIRGPKLVMLEEEQQETVSQVFFKPLKEKNEFVDMKMDSPKSLNMGFLPPQIDVGAYQFDEKDGDFEEGEQIKEEIGTKLDEKEGDWEEDNNGGLNVWKWAMSGIGALFSFGFAAATVSLIVLGNRHKDTKHSNNGKELHYKLYNHDKRMKQVVHHATKLNEAINNAVRGAPLTRAHVTIGGYYEGL